MSENKNSGWILIGLSLLMAATRFNHFGSLSTLPDASLAIFFFGGLYLRNMPWFVFLLIEATLIDFMAIKYGGVSNFCISPAYLFLIPAYGALWMSGHISARFSFLSVKGLLLTATTLIGAVSMSYLISNSSFYLLSNRFADLSWTNYINQFTRYYSHYLLTALMYASIIAMIHASIRLFASSHQQMSINSNHNR